jgi:putative ABC transport system permease protein
VLRRAAVDVSSLDTLRAQFQTVSQVAVHTRATLTLSAREGAVRLDGQQVSPELFSMLDVHPLIGRALVREASQDPATAVLLSYSAWQRHFSGDPNVVGKLVTMDRAERSVVGVMPAGFDFPEDGTQFWIPFVAPTGGRSPRLPVIARIRDGFSIDTAASEVDAVLRREQARAGDAAPAIPARFGLVSLQDELVGPMKPALDVLAAAVGVVLLIACLNIANLLLARALGRQREIAVRGALGAGRGRLVRQLLTESVVLALFGGIAGCALAVGGLQILRTLGASLPRRDLVPLSGLGVPRLNEIALDWPVLLFATALCVVSGVCAGLFPAIRQSRPSRLDALGDGSQPVATGIGVMRHLSMQSALVMSQIALAVTLLVGGGLLIQSFTNLSRVDPGYDPANVLTFQVVLPPSRSAGGPRPTAAEDFVAPLEAMSSGRSVGYAQGLPMVQLLREGLLRRTPDLPAQPPSAGSPGAANIRIVSRNFLHVMGVDVTAGRGFADGDAAGRPQVVLINRTLARSGFFEREPLGAQVYLLGRVPWEVVGIVEDVRQFGLDSQPGPQVFIDARQVPMGAPPLLAGDRSTYFALRTDTEPGAATLRIRDVVRGIDPQATVDNVAPMSRLVSNSISRQRLYAVLMGLFAAVSVALAATGIYGVMAHSVTRRTREIGIRVALGAQRPDVLRLVLGQSLLLTAVGMAAGLLGAAAGARVLDTMLFGVPALHPPIFLAASLVFVVAAVLAALVPLHRATRLSPLHAIQCE